MYLVRQSGTASLRIDRERQVDQSRRSEYDLLTAVGFTVAGSMVILVADDPGSSRAYYFRISPAWRGADCICVCSISGDCQALQRL